MLSKNTLVKLGHILENYLNAVLSLLENYKIPQIIVFTTISLLFNDCCSIQDQRQGSKN